jgi:flavin reductase (DIM6/NTAB) family NADH-FMN oxidoreductase RutF
VIVDPDGLSVDQSYTLLIGSVVPRPIAWTSSISAAGKRNLAPFSFFTVVSVAPPMLLIAIEPASDRAMKDTISNVRQTGNFAVNVVSLELADEMAFTSEEHSPDVDEFEIAGLTPVRSEVIAAPRVGEALITMECVLEQTLKPGDYDLLIGRIVRFHISDELISDGRIDIGKLRPLGRLAGTYTAVDRIFRLPLGGAPASARQ